MIQAAAVTAHPLTGANSCKMFTLTPEKNFQMIVVRFSDFGSLLVA